MDTCIFCRIVKGEIPSLKVWEDDQFLAFLDIFPYKKGHTMVIPKKHLPYVFGIDDQELADYIIATKKVADLLKKTFKPKSGKVGSIIYGLDVDHAHIHLIPIDRSGDLSPANKHPITEEEKTAIDQIKSAS